MAFFFVILISYFQQEIGWKNQGCCMSQKARAAERFLYRVGFDKTGKTCTNEELSFQVKGKSLSESSK